MNDLIQPEQDPKQVLITVDEVAKRLSIGRSHVYQQMQRGTLRSVRIGRSRRILERDVDYFIERLLDGSDGVVVRSEQLPRPSPVKRLPARTGRR